jgi:hypothetical protein
MRSPRGLCQRLISIYSMWVMSANTGMMAGAWYYRADDKPLYVLQFLYFDNSS